jgi:hypothetical protein
VRIVNHHNAKERAHMTTHQTTVIESDDDTLTCEFEYCDYGDAMTDILTRVETYDWGVMMVCLACLDGFRRLDGELEG